MGQAMNRFPDWAYTPLGAYCIGREFLERYQYEIASFVSQLIFIAAVIILGVLI